MIIIIPHRLGTFYYYYFTTLTVVVWTVTKIYRIKFYYFITETFSLITGPQIIVTFFYMQLIQ